MPLLIAFAIATAIGVVGTLARKLLSQAARDSFVELYETHRDRMCACVDAPGYEGASCVRQARIHFVDDRYNATPERYRTAESNDVSAYLYSFPSHRRRHLELVESDLERCAGRVTSESRGRSRR